MLEGLFAQLAQLFMRSEEYITTMYSKQEAAKLRSDFWTSFGQYMKPIVNANGEVINWVNYKTGIKHIFFRMDADYKKASIAIELRHADPVLREHYYQQFLQLKNVLHESIGEEWTWNTETIDDDGRQMSWIGIILPDVNVFDKGDWPAIISFLKPRIVALDEFWMGVREGFE